jgi:hypothetical protein
MYSVLCTELAHTMCTQMWRCHEYMPSSAAQAPYLVAQPVFSRIWGNTKGYY